MEATVAAKVLHHASGTTRIILEDIYLDGVFWRDHAWVGNNHRLPSKGRFTATCKTHSYPGLDGGSKIGVSHIRNVYPLPKV